jgi:hypothetical protein
MNCRAYVFLMRADIPLIFSGGSAFILAAMRRRAERD